MKNEKLFFNPIDGSGSLTLSWSSGPKGDAVEAKQGNGVGFFSEKGDLLSVIFDEVQSDKDRQTLVFNRERVGITVKNGRVTYTITKRRKVPLPRKKRSKRKQTT